MKTARNPSTTAPRQQSKRGVHISTFSSLQYRNFRYLWSATFFTAAGNWIQQITLGWLIFHMTGSAFLTGAVSGVRALPFLFAGPLGGVIADRVDRKMLLIVNHIFLAILGLAFAILIATGLIQVWHVFVFTLLSGIGWSMNNPVRQTLVPAVVPKESLMNAIALNSAAFNLTRIVGPAIGGLLIVAFGPATNFFIQAVAYGLVTVFVLPMRIPQRAAGSGPRRSMTGDLKDGIRYAVRQPLIRTLILVGLIPAVFMMPFTQALMPVFADTVLGVGAGGLGILLAASGFGAFTGTLTLASLGNFPHKGLLMIFAMIIAGASLVIFSQVTVLWLAIPILAVQGGLQMVYNSTNNTVLQIITPDEYRGRVVSLYMLDNGLAPLGAFMAGAIAQFMGASTAFLAGGAATLVLVLLLTSRSTRLRQFRG